VLDFKEVEGDRGEACAIDCISKMMYNLAFMLRHGTVVINDEPSYIFMWNIDNHEEFARTFLHLQKSIKQVYLELVSYLETKEPHLMRRSINKAIVEYHKDSLHNTEDDVAGKQESEVHDCAWYYCAFTSKVYTPNPTRDTNALNFKFRSDKRITQKTLDEARHWVVNHIENDQEKEMK